MPRHYEALSAVISDRLGDAFEGEITGMYAGPVPIPIPDGMKDPKQLMKLFANTSYAMQLGQAAGALSLEVRGSFDQGIRMLDNPAGGLIMQNVDDYATSLEFDASEVTEFLALREQAYARRLYASVPWLMPRFTALIGKYARGITIDLDAMEEQLRDASAFDPESLSGAVNLANVGITDTPEQREALRSIETLLALVEGWVDCAVWRAGMAHLPGAVNLANVGITDTPEQREALRSIETLLALVEGWVDCAVWRAGMAHLPHLDQLREMMRRERAVGGPALRSIETLLALVEGWVDCAVWRAGMAHLPHLDQLREMMRRERAVGGPAELTFENLLGLQLRPKRVREAAAQWERITNEQGLEARDAMWGHPDMLPALPSDAERRHRRRHHWPRRGRAAQGQLDRLGRRIEQTAR